MSGLIVVIFGSRDVVLGPAHIERGLKLLDMTEHDIAEVVSGMARGADHWGATWARSVGIPVKEMPADWNGYGKRAGFVRNRQMAEYAHCGLGFWRHESNGTANMATHLIALRKPVEIVEMS